jgi:hypothetical protein
MKNYYRPEYMCDNMMNTNQFVADIGYKSDDAERHQYKYNK